MQSQFKRCTLQLGRHKKTNGSYSAVEIVGQATMKDPDHMYWNRRLSVITRTVIVMRIVGVDVGLNATEDHLANKIFGSNGDVFNLKSGFERCSHGAMRIQPVTNNAIIGLDGVYTVNLSSTIINGSKAGKIIDLVMAKATKDFGISPFKLANHIMFCFP